MIDFNNPGFAMDREMPVKTLNEYLEKAYSLETDDEKENYIEADENFKECEMLQHVIALEVSIFILGKTNCLCASNIDALRGMRNELLISYHQDLKKIYHDYNENIV